MKELKDIELKKGDIIYYNNRTCEAIVVDCKIITTGKREVIKIERPVKYETIYGAPKKILDKEEKEYLENVIRPFRDRIPHIYKKNYCGGVSQYLEICFELDPNDFMTFPNFPKGTMYKGMEVDKEYTLKELGLFE